MDSFEVGNRVKVLENELPYAGTIITYDDTHYKVSVDGLGKVNSFEESDMELLPGGGGGGGTQPLFSKSVVNKAYSGAITTYTVTQKGYYAALGAVDGYAGVVVSYSTTATVLDVKSKQATATSWGCSVVGLIADADEGDTITFTCGGYSRSVMIVIFIPDRVKSIGEIILSAGKDSSATASIAKITKNYCFYIAGSTGDNGVSVSVTSAGDAMWGEEITDPKTKHIYGAYDDALTASASGTSYATNYAMVFEVSA